MLRKWRHCGLYQFGENVYIILLYIFVHRMVIIISINAQNSQLMTTKIEKMKRSTLNLIVVVKIPRTYHLTIFPLLSPFPLKAFAWATVLTRQMFMLADFDTLIYACLSVIV